MKFCIIDASNLIQRAKHGVFNNMKQTRGLRYLGPRDEEDDPIEAERQQKESIMMDVIFSAIRKSAIRFDADHVVVCFDSESWRKQLYEDYKKKDKIKDVTPEEIENKEIIDRTINTVYQYLQKHTNVTVLRGDPAEADDFIARWVQIHDDAAFHHIIISRDSDFKQLVRDNVELYAPVEEYLYTANGVFYQENQTKKQIVQEAGKDIPKAIHYGEEWKVLLDDNGDPVVFDPAWELFEKCIRGDTSDNIKSAFPRVQKTTMKKAFYGGTIEWNSFLNSKWGPKDNKQLVKDRYELNKMLIDLSAQPDIVIEYMDEIIGKEIDKPPGFMIGAYLRKFAVKHGLKWVQQSPTEYINVLSKAYPLAEAA